MANARRSNFDLNKSVNLRDIDLQGKELRRQRSAGLRDIGQSREQGLEAAVNNALQRGILRSGITTENKRMVEREAGEASSDLRSRIGISLQQLANRRRGTAGQQFVSGDSGSDDPLADAMNEFLRWLEERDDGSSPDFSGANPPPIVRGGPG